MSRCLSRTVLTMTHHGACRNHSLTKTAIHSGEALSVNCTKAVRPQGDNVLHLERQRGGVPPKDLGGALVMIPPDPGLQDGRKL